MGVRSRLGAMLVCAWLHAGVSWAQPSAEPPPPPPETPAAETPTAETPPAEAAPQHAATTQPSFAEAPVSPKNAPRWYGHQTLLVDGLGLAAGMVLGASRDSGAPLGTMAAAWYGVGLIGAPAVHYAHGNVGTGLASAGMRMWLPPLAATLGMLTTCMGRNDAFGDDCEINGLIGGSLVGLVGAAAFDAVLLADERHALRSADEEHWYGSQILLVDTVGLALGLWLAADKPRTRAGERLHPALSTWTLFYTVGLIGAPIVHFAHGQVGKGFGSLALRLLLAPAGALPGLLGYCAATGGEKNCISTGAQWGLLGGTLAVSMLDALVLAHESVEADSARGARAYAPSLHLGPGTIACSGYW